MTPRTASTDPQFSHFFRLSPNTGGNAMSEAEFRIYVASHIID